jgi:hypothetical protein
MSLHPDTHMLVHTQHALVVNAVVHLLCTWPKGTMSLHSDTHMSVHTQHASVIDAVVPLALQLAQRHDVPAIGHIHVSIH